jgi:hypothetical protein
MSTLITQIWGREENTIVLRVEGTLYREDAEILERACADLRGARPDSDITLDLADLNFFDSESASILRRVGEGQCVRLDGLQASVQRALELAERARNGPTGARKGQIVEEASVN